MDWMTGAGTVMYSERERGRGGMNHSRWEGIPPEAYCLMQSPPVMPVPTGKAWGEKRCDARFQNRGWCGDDLARRLTKGCCRDLVSWQLRIWSSPSCLWITPLRQTDRQTAGWAQWPRLKPMPGSGSSRLFCVRKSRGSLENSQFQCFRRRWKTKTERLRPEVLKYESSFCV